MNAPLSHTRTAILRIASAEIGYKETPPGSNRTKYGKWFGLDGVPWCGIFVSWVYDQAGANLGKIGYLRGFAGCATAVAHFRRTDEVVSDPQPGDLVFLDFNKDGRFDHVGIFRRRLSAHTFEVVEGNTAVGNDSNGGQVMLRVRKYGAGVLFVSPKVITQRR